MRSLPLLLPIAMVTLSTSGIASAAANARAAMELLKYRPGAILAARNAGRPTA